jgi:hypothetical protein
MKFLSLLERYFFAVLLYVHHRMQEFDSFDSTPTC